MEGLEAKTNAVRASFQELAALVVDSDLVKSILDLANAFLKLAKTPVGVFVTQMALLTGVLWGGTGLIHAMQIIPNALGKIAGGVKAVGAAASISAPHLALIAGAIAAIIAVAPKAIDWFKKLTDEGYDAQQKLDGLNEQLAENKARLEELNAIPEKNRTDGMQAEIDKLKEQNTELEKNIKLQDERLTLSDFEKNYLGTKNVQGNIVRDTQGGVLHDNSQNLILVNSAEDALNRLVEVGVITREELNATLIGVNNDTAKALEQLGYTLDNGSKTLTAQEYYQDALKGVQEAIDELKSGADLSANLVDQFLKSKDALDELREAASKVPESELEPWMQEILETASKLPDITNQVADGYYNTADSLIQLSNGMQINQLQRDQLLQEYPQLVDVLQEVDKGFVASSEGLSTLITEISNAHGVVSELSSSFGALISQEGASRVEIEKLIKAYPALASMIKQTNGAYYLEIDALSASASAGNKWAIALIDNQNQATQKAIEQTQHRIDALIAESQAFVKTHPGIISVGMENYYMQQINELYRKKSSLENLKNSISNIASKDYDFSVDVPDYSGSSSPTKKDPIAEQNRLFKEQIEILEHKLFLMQKEGASEEAQIAQLRKIQAELEKQKKWYYSQGLDANSEYIRELEEQWWGYEDQIKNLYKEQANIYETLFSTVASKAQDEIDALNKKKSELQKQNDELEKQIRLEEALDNLARAKQNKVMVYKDGRFQYVEDADAVSSAQKDVDDIKREEALNDQLEAIDKEIEGWEDYKKAWGSVVNDYKNKQDELLLEQKLGIKLEGENWQKRLKSLQYYINKYNNLLMKAGNPNANLSARSYSLSSTPRLMTASGNSQRNNQTLWSMGVPTPSSMMNAVSGDIQSLGQNIGINIQNFNPNLPNVTDGEGFANYMKNNFWREALQFAKV